MDKKNLMPQQTQPIERITTGQLPDVLAELSEEALGRSTLRSEYSASVLPQWGSSQNRCACSYEDAE
ncbi:DUF5837 family protein [Kamptonema animale CS-326]|jgi:bacteriocin leader peptide (microcyclamide/patellamide family)|uniref:DUF5837 family cyanobactin class RiPP n=1 Tax=Kamptonema animale TaxID=92934 RepID=UPI00232DD3B4|nr:DUF5837 family cyanobactin class RiPP [Kamptonema animale]MDB9513175.1 DUF5837 family protein [Kamptonema animale CS-326]